ncbi:hypothetical protein OG612_45120 (plasmid) [Streptomyces sp. NBC_01527]|uniref:hypothetical protein n=1 Tax=Streptomyces sp. NBC_01527 TaxID=2903894 RepID=UPI002F90D2FF
MPYTIPLKRPLDDTGLSHRQTAAQSTPSRAQIVADVARYHHPHFLQVEPGRYEGSVTYYFTAFTGRETEPEMPLTVYGDKSVTYEQRRELADQYEAARGAWSQARLRLEATPVLRKAAPLWEAWTTAQAALHQVFNEFRSTADGQWRAQLLRLTDAERAAKTAAEAWDKIAGQLAGLSAAQVRAAGEEHELELTDVAKEIGLDAQPWHINHTSEYDPTHVWHDTPVVAVLTLQIDQQRERLREVDHLAGDRELA